MPADIQPPYAGISQKALTPFADWLCYNPDKLHSLILLVFVEHEI